MICDHLLQSVIKPLPMLVQHHGIGVAVKLLKAQPWVVLLLDFLNGVLEQRPYTVDVLFVHGHLKAKRHIRTWFDMSGHSDRVRFPSYKLSRWFCGHRLEILGEVLVLHGFWWEVSTRILFPISFGRFQIHFTVYWQAQVTMIHLPMKILNYRNVRHFFLVWFWIIIWAELSILMDLPIRGHQSTQ